MGQDKEEKKGSSPVPNAFKETLEKKGLMKDEQILMSFGTILKLLITGDLRARRIGWLEQGAPEDYITMRGGQLHIFTKGKMHTLTVNDGDITNEDWVII